VLRCSFTPRRRRLIFPFIAQKESGKGESKAEGLTEISTSQSLQADVMED